MMMTRKLKTALIGSAMLAGMAAAPASAAVTFTFTPDGFSPSAGFTVVNAFNSTAGLTGSGFITQTGSNSNGASPDNSVPFGTSYLAVQAGGSATYAFAAGVTAFQFDWGSIDSFNTLSFTGSAGTQTVRPGIDFSTPANGNQTSAATNGLFTVRGTAGETFSNVTFASSQNSFEVDNLATPSAVPEPATWAMMIAGFGFVGASMRRRRSRVRTAVSFV